MTMQTELHDVLIEMAAARLALAEAEQLRLMSQRAVRLAEAGLASTKTALMGMAEAGTNDAQRRAYAERETVYERDNVTGAQFQLVDAEIDLISAQARLAIAIDRRRYLETVIQLAADDAAAGDNLMTVIDRLTLAYADDGRGEMPYLTDDDDNPFRE